MKTVLEQLVIVIARNKRQVQQFVSAIERDENRAGSANTGGKRSSE